MKYIAAVTNISGQTEVERWVVIISHIIIKLKITSRIFLNFTFCIVILFKFSLTTATHKIQGVEMIHICLI